MADGSPEIRPGDVRIGAFIPAAGEGRRLRPATFIKPKALAPVCGVPLLELAISRVLALADAGVVVNACYLADQVETAVSEYAALYRTEIAVSRESRLLGTGGGFRTAIRRIPGAEHILLHNVDILVDVDLRALVSRHLASGAMATLLLIPGRGPLTVDMDPETRRIVSVRRARGTGEFTFAGVQVVRRELVEFLPDREACSIVDAWEAAAEHGSPVLGFPVEPGTFWVDTGTPQAYIRAHAEAADRGLRFHNRLRVGQEEQARRRAKLEAEGVTCSGALGIGRDVRVTPGAHLHNVVLWDGAEVTRPVLYADTILPGGPVPTPPPVDDQRRPDPRVYRCLDLDPERCTVQPLRKQGSGRRYARIRCRVQDAQREESWIWCAYSHERRENAGFAAIACFLERLGLRVPAVDLHLGDVGEVVLRDLGNADLQHETDPGTIESILLDAVGQIARLHVLGDRAVRLEEFPLQPGFTKGLYDWERDYFRTHILDGVLGHPELWAPVADEYCRIRTLLLSQPLTPVHRDLQSANIMIRDGRAWLIDFQGMRLGCAAYDLASLLFDPYMAHPLSRRRRVWNAYRRNVKELGGIPPRHEVLYAAAVQRLFQALGAYGNLWRNKKLEWFRQFIIPGLQMLRTAAVESREYPAVTELAQECLALAREKLGP